MWQAIAAQGLQAGLQQQNNTNAHSYVVPSGYSQAPFYLTILGVIAVIGLVGYVLFNKK